MLRSISFQIAMAYESFCVRLLELCETTGLKLGQPKPPVIWERIFEGNLFPMSLDAPLYWVIDGLDESESNATLLKMFQKIKSSTKINILFFSRQHTDILQDMTRYLPTTIHEHITSDDIFEDVGEYIKNSMRHLLSWQYHEYITGEILHRAAGSFLWVKLVLEKIKSNWHTHEGIMRALTELPEGMEAMFENMVADISRSRLSEMAARILT